MEWVIYGGTAVSLVGLCALIWSIVMVTRAKRAKLEDTALRAIVQRAMPWNLGGLFLSMLGLMAVIVGVKLG